MVVPEVGMVFENKYKILQPLGHGGFANVFLAEDMETAVRVVLKLPNVYELGDPAVYERFRREMAIGQLLNHPDLPTALALSDGNPPYLALKYMEGESLAQILKDKGKFPIEQSLAMIVNLLDALHHCHEQGIYHRDIKPENLLLAPDGHLKIIDFGIAMMKGAPRVTYRGFSNLVGTPEYMAPEQVKGERGSAQTDIYAVGCLAYHLLSGEPPFTGDNPLTIMYQHMNENPKPLTEVLPELHPGVWAVIRRSLRRRKEERYESAREMANELNHPERVDLKWVNEPDPTMVSVLPDNRTQWWVVGGSVVFALVLVLVFILLRKF